MGDPELLELFPDSGGQESEAAFAALMGPAP
jgi:hypothetical protein